VKWKGYPYSENRVEPVEGLENLEELVHAWLTDNMPEEEFPTICSSYITVCFSPSKDGYEEHSEEVTVDLEFGNPIWTLITIARRFRFCCSYMFEIIFSLYFVFQSVSVLGSWFNFGVSFDTQYVLCFILEYRLILTMFYVWFRVSLDTQYLL